LCGGRLKLSVRHEFHQSGKVVVRMSHRFGGLATALYGVVAVLALGSTDIHGDDSDSITEKMQKSSVEIRECPLPYSSLGKRT
jgi:hypothetical protein